MLHRMDHADRIAILEQATPVIPQPGSPIWVDFWSPQKMAEALAAVAELTK